jgi:hypothetical protein
MDMMVEFISLQFKELGFTQKIISIMDKNKHFYFQVGYGTLDK